MLTLSTDPLQARSPSSSDSQGGTPKSTESEQSQALDVPDADPEFDIFNFDFPVQSHQRDFFSSLPAYEPINGTADKALGSDATMLSTFGSGFGDFGAFTGLGDTAAEQLGLTNLLTKLAAPSPTTASTGVESSLTAAYQALGWAQSTVEPAALVNSPQPSLKRKNSDDVASSPPVASKRPRGRPPKSRSGDVPLPTSAKRRQSQAGSEFSSPSATPLISTGTLVNTPEAHSVKLTATGKLSTARPKSVVPEKYLKDGSALSILGMTVDEIQTFPTFEDLLRKVHPSKQAAAAEFGLRIADNRDKAKDAAKKSRDERRQKIESLEDTVQTLETKVVGLQNLLLQLVAKGLVSQGDIASLMS